MEKGYVTIDILRYEGLLECETRRAILEEMAEKNTYMGFEEVLDVLGLTTASRKVRAKRAEDHEKFSKKLNDGEILHV